MTQPPYQPQPARPRSRRTLWIVLASVAGVLVLCCAGALIVGAIVGPPKTKPAAAPATTTTQATSAAPSTAPATQATTPAATTKPPSSAPKSSAPAADPDREICSFVDNAGTYYLYVTSATAHDFDACIGGTPYAGTIDNLLNTPTMDRRCILGPDATARYQAIIGVYSSTKRADLDAAHSYCRANGGTDNG